jgi:ubiquinone/menaquinone biosynthesis C-methylase UbiE
MLADFKQAIADNDFIRTFVQSLFIMGDSIRPIVQKPIVSKFIGNNLHEYALDAGCGRGLYTRILLKRAKKVAALDYSKNSIDTLKRRLGHLPHLSLYVGSADNLPFEAEQFDLVLHCEVLEHIENDRKVLSELFRVLQPGGRLIISVPVPPAPYNDSEHVREGYTLDQISQFLHNSGFEILRHEYCMFKFSKKLMQFLVWWGQKTRIRLPSLFLLPVYWERISKQSISEHNLPYDVVIEARKPSADK